VDGGQVKTRLPKQVKILDVLYSIEYVEKPSDVDIYKRESLWGQVDYWTRTIRIYDNDRQSADVWQTVWHEVLHALCQKLDIDSSDGKLGADEKALDLLATGINSVLLDNGWMA
jgi:hypothetical protein